MKKKVEGKKKNFFQKVWISIKDFEGYEEFAAERVSKAIVYLLILTLLFVVVIAIAYTYQFYLAIEHTKSYVRDNIEELSLVDGRLEVKAKEELIIENENYMIPIIIIDTEEGAEEKYQEKLKAYHAGILVLSDKIVMKSSLLSEQEPIYYSNLFDFNLEGKEAFLELIQGQPFFYGIVVFCITLIIYLFFVYFGSNLIDALILSALGYLFARIMKIPLRYKATFNIGIHAITLPLILNLIYIIVNLYSGFEIEHFQWMYTSVSYIYVVVAILMIKAEIINQRIQLIRLKEIQEKEAKKVEEKGAEENQDEKPKEKEEKEKEERNSGEEPEGSKA